MWNQLHGFNKVGSQLWRTLFGSTKVAFQAERTSTVCQTTVIWRQCEWKRTQDQTNVLKGHWWWYLCTYNDAGKKLFMLSIPSELHLTVAITRANARRKDTRACEAIQSWVNEIWTKKRIPQLFTILGHCCLYWIKWNPFLKNCPRTSQLRSSKTFDSIYV